MEKQRIGENIRNHSCPLVVSVTNPESLKGYFHYIENRISTLSVEVKISWAKTVLRNNNQGPFFFFIRSREKVTLDILVRQENVYGI